MGQGEKGAQDHGGEAYSQRPSAIIAAPNTAKGIATNTTRLSFLLNSIGGNWG